MRTLIVGVLSIWILVSGAPSARAQNTNTFELRDGDRVVLVGDTLIEREQTHGFLEFMLTTQFPDRNVTFRNLGWSGDMPEGQSRVGFDHAKPPTFWFQQLTNAIALLKPTVVFLGYGMANSFDGDSGLPGFVAGLNRLIDAIQENSGTNGVRFVVLSTIPHEKLPPPLPDPAKHNEQLAAYTKALKELAAKRDASFVNLFEALDAKRATQPVSPITDDGIHLNGYGYRRAAEVISAAFNWEPHIWRLGVMPDGKARDGNFGTRTKEIERTDDRVRIVLETDQLVNPPWPKTEKARPLATPANRLQVLELKEGNYSVKIDGEFIRSVDALQCRSSFPIDRGPQFDQASALLAAIRKKNELFFNRWRPENNTYLFLFRKHEQGQNAREIPQFDPLIEEQEKTIAGLRRPRRHVIELAPYQGETLQSEPVVKAPVFDQTPLAPPQFDLDPNLEISLYAENPLLAKPIHMNFDAQGRLWVASSEVYPQIKPGQEATDKIIVIEDKDGDGRAETSSVFAEGLLIPTGIAPGDGGAYVGQSTELLHFRDTDGDGKADQRRVVLSAFGTEDTHHILHTLRWGEDGQLYMNQSIYIHTHAETPHGVIRLNSGGILNLRPGTMELGIHMKGLVNSWGHAIDAFGQSFATDGASSADAGQGGIFYVVPQAMYLTYAGARRILDSTSPSSYPKFSGLEIIRSPHFPEEWQGQFVTCDFRAHRVARFAIADKDSAYVTTPQADLVRTKDVAFRPIDIKLGPDGALYIADWSNPIIQHGEVDFRDRRRDHEHGRIWRITYKNRPLSRKPTLANARNTNLLENLLSPDHFTRSQSKRVLLDRGPGAMRDSGARPLNTSSNFIADLDAWTKRQTAERARLEALWMYQAVDRVESALLGGLLEAKDPRVRAAAVRVLAFWQERHPTSAPGYAKAWQGWSPAPQPLPHRMEIPTSRALELLAARAADEHPRVRLEAVRALARIPDARAADLVLSVLTKPMDPFLDYALWLTINDLAQPWLTAVKSGVWKPDGREKQLEFGLKAIEPAQASEVLGQLLGAKPLPRDGSGPWIELIGQAGTAKELRLIFDQLLDSGFDENAAARSLASLNQAVRLRSVRPSGDLSAVGKLFNNPNEKVCEAAVRLAGGWKNLGPHFPQLAKLAGGKDTPPGVRQAAFESLRDIGGSGAVETLVPLTTSETAPAIRRQAVLALAALQFDKAAPAAIEVLVGSANDDESLSLWRALLANKGAGPAMTRALPKTGFPTPVAKAGLRAAREGGRNEPELILALTRSAGLEEGEVTLTEAELKKLATDVVSKGDPARGEAIYRRKDLNCVACHAIGGAGGKVGPDMTSIGASAPMDYLIESVWFPNRKIKEGYHAVSVETKDGQEFSGVLVREDTAQVVLRDATGKELSIAKNNIEDRRIGTLSLMPAGLIDGLTNQERIDLFRFLSELGKPGPYDATKANVARVWRVRPGIHTLEQFGEEKFVISDLNGREWLPVHANVDGRLPAEAIREAAMPGKYLGLVGLYAAAQLQLAEPGKVTLKFNGTADAAMWVDGKPVKPAPSMSAELTGGTHIITVRLDPKKLPEGLRLESSTGTFLVN